MDFSINAKAVTGTRYMAITGSLYSNKAGYSMLRDSTITGVVVQIDNLSGTFNINIHKNNGTTPIYSVSLTNENQKIIKDVNIDLDEGDFVQAIVQNVNSSISYPNVLLEYGWRTTY